MSEQLINARKYETENEKKIEMLDRPAFHLSSRVGWMNDPNGFSYYKGQYHMFYQNHPYDATWGPMHWGHAVSKDLLDWTYMPVALAPDEYYDANGCFSGTAIENDKGEHLLIYTSVMTRTLEDGSKKDFQQQSIAIGDGENYKKYEANPVIATSQIPEGLSVVDFRDPKIWIGNDGIYRCIIGAKDMNDNGKILLFKSKDCIHWQYIKVFASNNGSYGKMWECPDFFQLDGKAVLIVSPQDMLPVGFEFHNGNGTLCLIGEYDEEKDIFTPEYYQSVDYGIDFYAPQSVETDDGRRVMIGWMQNWDTSGGHNHNDPYFGQMSLPRELRVINNRLYQYPIKELDNLRGEKTEYKDILIGDSTDEISLEGIEGRTIDMEIELEAVDADNLYDKFVISMAKNENFHTDFIFRPKESVVKVDRKFSGSRRALVHQRRAEIASKTGKLKARFILDRYSIEVFLEDGRQVMSTTITTDLKADKITFQSFGKVKMNVVKYDLAERGSK